MKQLLQRIVLLFVTIAVFTTGMGANIVNICCDSCGENHTLFSIQKCCLSAGKATAFAAEHQSAQQGCKDDDRHQPVHDQGCCDDADAHNEAAAGKSACDIHDAGHKHCSIERVSIDLNSQSYRPQIFAPIVWLSDASLFAQLTLARADERIAPTEGVVDPVSLPPRVYLSLIRVLII